MLRILLTECSISFITVATLPSVPSIKSFCWVIISCAFVIVSTTSSESFNKVSTISSILPLALFVCSASFWISDATTANPLPASPALAASMLAFKANRFVSSAISEIKREASRIFCADAFVCFVCCAIVSTAWCTSSLITRSWCTISVAWSLAFFMLSAPLPRSSASCPVSNSRFPILFTLKDAFLISSACRSAPSVIPSIVSLTFSMLWKVWCAVCSNESDESRRESVLPLMPLIMPSNSCWSLRIARDRSPISSLRRASLSDIVNCRFPADTCWTDAIPTLSAFVIELAQILTTITHTIVTNTTIAIIVLIIFITLRNVSCLGLPANTIPIGVLLSSGWYTGVKYP